VKAEIFRSSDVLATAVFPGLLFRGYFIGFDCASYCHLYKFCIANYLNHKEFRLAGKLHPRLMRLLADSSSSKRQDTWALETEQAIMHDAVAT
jgi:hypothetical protein